MHERDRPAFFGLLSTLLADDRVKPRVRQAASAAMKQAMAAARGASPTKELRPRPPTKPQHGGKASARRQQKAAATESAVSNALTELQPEPEPEPGTGREGGTGAGAKMLDIMQRVGLPPLVVPPPRLDGGALPVQQLQLELLHALAAEERQAAFLREVGRRAQKEHLQQKFSPFEAVGTAAAVRTPRQETTAPRSARRWKPAPKLGSALTADQAFAEALAERKLHRPTSTVTSWSAHDTRDPKVREWLHSKQMESIEPETLELVNWILILTRRGNMTESRYLNSRPHRSSITRMFLTDCVCLQVTRVDEPARDDSERMAAKDPLRDGERRLLPALTAQA